MAGVNVPLLPNEMARKEGPGFQVRSGPLRLQWVFDDLASSDGHRVRCTFVCSMTVVNEPSELKMLEEVFMARAGSVKADAVIAHFTPAFHGAAARILQGHKAEALIGQDAAARQALIDALKQTGKAVAFSAGLEILAPFDASFESASFQAQKIEEMQRTLAERRVAGQVEHFEKAAALLKRFDELRSANPDLTPADVLKMLSPADQGTMLQTLLLASGRADAGKTLWAVSGNALVKIDGHKTPATIQSVPLPEALGPLRSVQPASINGQGVLLVGARSGVWVYDLESGSATPLADRTIDSQMGFSAACVWNDQVWACHGDAGVVAWKLESPEAPAVTIRPGELRGADNPPPIPTTPSPQATYVSSGGFVTSIAVRTAGIRNIRALDEQRLILSVGHNLVVIDPTGQRRQIPMPGTAEVVAIVPDTKRLLVAQEDGLFTVLERTSLDVISQQRRAGRVITAAPLPWLGTIRLLLATEEGPIVCVGPDDELMTQYLSNHRGLRVVSAAADLIAAVSADRQRIVLWHSWDGSKPIAEVAIAAATRHRAGDIDFA